MSRKELSDGIDIEHAADIIIGPIINRLLFTRQPIPHVDMERYTQGALLGISGLKPNKTQQGKVSIQPAHSGPNVSTSHEKGKNQCQQ
ncbi:TetR-like C-terminal domain-containing protein [Denitratisoma sp. DHT3]|uniref:TetR-like C-terminal domain-containing protein n=1 Tax=Denitratisoma sp. DHT3 TaxID=1981880 RepID=UPI001647049C